MKMSKKFGLAAAVDGFSEGMQRGVGMVSDVIERKNNQRQREIENERQRRQEARQQAVFDAGMEDRQRESRLQSAQRRAETIKAGQQARLDQALSRDGSGSGAGAGGAAPAAVSGRPQSLVDYGANIVGRIYKYWNSLPQERRAEFNQGRANAVAMRFKLGDEYLATAEVMASASLDALKQSPPDAAQAVQKMLSDTFGIDISQVDAMRETPDEGLEILSGGKVVGRLDCDQRHVLMMGLYQNGSDQYRAGQDVLRQLQEEDESQATRAETVIKGPGGLLGRARGDEFVPLRGQPQVGLSGARPKPEETPAEQPEFAFEFARQVAADGTAGPRLPVKTNSKKFKKWFGNDNPNLKEIMEKSAEDPSMNDAAEEYVHSYIRDVYSRAKKALIMKSADGTYSEKELGSLMRKHMRQEGFSKLEPYVAAHYRDILGIE